MYTTVPSRHLRTRIKLSSPLAQYMMTMSHDYAIPTSLSQQPPLDHRPDKMSPTPPPPVRHPQPHRDSTTEALEDPPPFPSYRQWLATKTNLPAHVDPKSPAPGSAQAGPADQGLDVARVLKKTAGRSEVPTFKRSAASNPPALPSADNAASDYPATEGSLAVTSVPALALRSPSRHSTAVTKSTSPSSPDFDLSSKHILDHQHQHPFPAPKAHLMKRVMQQQGGTERYGHERCGNTDISDVVDVPRRASAAQMAKREIAPLRRR